MRLKNPEGELYSRNHPRVHERKAPGRAPADGAAGTALGRAEVWGQRPQLLSNVGVRTNEHRLFDSAEHLTGRAPAGDAAGQALKTSTRCGCSLATSVARQEAHFRLLDLTRLNELCLASSFGWPKGHWP